VPLVITDGTEMNSPVAYLACTSEGPSAYGPDAAPRRFSGKFVQGFFCECAQPHETVISLCAPMLLVFGDIS
jgi:hypothetical protein